MEAVVGQLPSVLGRVGMAVVGLEVVGKTVFALL